MKRPRDSQRAKCYAAERSTPMWGVMQWGTRATIEQCQQFVDDVLARSWAVAKWKRAPHRHIRGKTIITLRSVEVCDSQGKGGACATRGTIYVSTYYRNHLVLLHELAHCLTPSTTYAAHGREWAAAYLELVTRVMGRTAGQELRAAFKAHKVKYRPVTEAQREAGRRLAQRAAEQGRGFGQALARAGSIR